MARSNSSNGSENQALPSKLLALISESRWLLLVAIGLYLIIILYGFDLGDPSWSHSTSNVSTQNPGGIFGAWLSDVMFYVFGFSSWWWVVLVLSRVTLGVFGLPERADSVFQSRPFWLSVIGFSLLLIASCGLEYLRLHTWKVTLPLVSGGMLGELIGDVVGHVLGFIGATILFLALMTVGFSLFIGLSWLRFIVKLGALLEACYVWIRNTWQTYQDKKIGIQATTDRTIVVEEEKKRAGVHQPIYIEPPVKEVQTSIRVEQEKQVPLFAELPDSPLPPLHLLDAATQQVEVVSQETLEFTSRLIERKLKDFNVEVNVIGAYQGPVITRYEIEPAVGVKGSQIISLVKDLARALSVSSIRMVETIPGKTYMALELPNQKRQIVKLSEILSSKAYADMHSALTMAMGKDISGNPVVADLAKMPHVLVAGTTGSGKSVAINAMILSLLYKATPQQVRLLLIDPKMLELSVYEGIPHLLTPVVTDMRQAASALNWCVQEMERRYKLMSALGVRNLAGFNQKYRESLKDGVKLTNPFSITPDNPEPLEELPMIVVFIDELADLMMVVGKKIEELIVRLAQKARASGIHLVLATQSPRADVITGLIKANVPSRVAFQVSGKIDSRIILDQMGAEALLGQGDMLYMPPGSGYPQRVHGAFVSDQEVHRVAEYIKSQSEPNYIEGVLSSIEDEESVEMESGGSEVESDLLYDQAVALVLKSRRASISYVQRDLRIGYNRAARFIEQMERAGLVSAMQTNGNREVLVPARSE